MNLINLVKFIVSREQRVQSDYFKKDAANAPQVHLVPVVTVSQQTLRRSVPPRAYVLSVRLFRVNSSTTTEISELHCIVHDQNVFGFYVTVENTVSVHVVNGFQ